MNEFNEVIPLRFYATLEDIKKELTKVAPEWRVESHTKDGKTFYHLARWDFTHGKDQHWSVELDSHIFAYVDHNADIYYLLNKYPIH